MYWTACNFTCTVLVFWLCFGSSLSRGQCAGPMVKSNDIASEHHAVRPGAGALSLTSTGKADSRSRCCTRDCGHGLYSGIRSSWWVGRLVDGHRLDRDARVFGFGLDSHRVDSPKVQALAHQLLYRRMMVQSNKGTCLSDLLGNAIKAGERVIVVPANISPESKEVCGRLAHLRCSEAMLVLLSGPVSPGFGKMPSRGRAHLFPRHVDRGQCLDP